MSTQVVRVEGYSKGSLSAIGNEFDHNPNVNHRNSDIDLERSHLNMDLKCHERGFYAEWNDIKTRLNASYKEKKGAVAFEGMVITADKEFFGKLGYVEGQPMTKEMERYFRDSYEWAVQQIGYRGTDKNILGAKVHMDEGTPHLHIYYLPVVEKWREKVYERDAEGKILRTERGTPIQAKDERGKTLYRPVEDLQAPKLARTEFWAVRGGQSSYRMMQDSYHEAVAKGYGLERGEIGSDRKHKTKAQHEYEQLEAKLQPHREDVAAINEIESTGKRLLPFSSKVVIDGAALEEIKRQATEHVAQKAQIKENWKLVHEAMDCYKETSREFHEHEKAVEAKLAEREERVAVREKECDAREHEINEHIVRLNKATANVTAKWEQNKTVHEDLATARAELSEVREENYALRLENGSLRAELNKFKEKCQSLEKRLEERVKAFKETCSALVLAVARGWKWKDLKQIVPEEVRKEVTRELNKMHERSR